jgi:hypothetical protein
MLLKEAFRLKELECGDREVWYMDSQQPTAVVVESEVLPGFAGPAGFAVLHLPTFTWDTFSFLCSGASGQTLTTTLGFQDSKGQDET